MKNRRTIGILVLALSAALVAPASPAAESASPGPDPSAIPWLFLSAKSTSGTGVFTSTQSIQRLWTAGGRAPAQGCDAAHAGAEARIPYTATYTFSVAKP